MISLPLISFQSKTLCYLKRFFAPIFVIASQTYAFTVWVISKAVNCMAFVIGTTAQSVLFFTSKISAVFRYIHRRIYVWKILTVRNQWYESKNGNFYNPKLKVTIYPSWECTWNIAQSRKHYKGYDTKKHAQEIAFKMWMKNRLLKKRLEPHKLETTNLINLKQKILPNQMNLRPVTFCDAPQLLILMKQLGYPQTDESMKSRIRTYSCEPNHQILVATRGKKIVGFIAFVIYELFVSEGKRCHIEGLIVEANQHTLNVRRKLLQAVEVFARENNSKVIDLTAGLSRSQKDGTHDFYKFLGYHNEGSKAEMYLRKEL